MTNYLTNAYNNYINWLFELVCNENVINREIYSKLLLYLAGKPFRYCIYKDANREEDGKDLRYRFSRIYNYKNFEKYLDTPCSVLEMMVALALRCEEDIMDNPDIGNRTSQWFWEMIKNLGLSSMINDFYDEDIVDSIVERFLDREYEPDGDGGLFRIRGCREDLTHVEIWYQLCWYLDSME